MSPSILLEIPQEIALQLKLPPKRAKKMLMEELVLRWHEDGIVASGQGAALLRTERLRYRTDILSQLFHGIHIPQSVIEHLY